LQGTILQLERRRDWFALRFAEYDRPFKGGCCSPDRNPERDRIGLFSTLICVSENWKYEITSNGRRDLRKFIYSPPLETGKSVRTA
jgi:hypothetical protein